MAQGTVTNGNQAAETNGTSHGQPLDLTVLGMNSGTSMVSVLFTDVYKPWWLMRAGWH